MRTRNFKEQIFVNEIIPYASLIAFEFWSIPNRISKLTNTSKIVDNI